MSNRPGAVLFDFDGTLVHITIDFQEMRESALAVIARYGHEGDASPYTLELIESVRDRIASTDSALAEAFQREALATIQKVELLAAKKAVPLPHVADMLNWLKERGIKIGIVTRNCREAVREVLRRHHLPFDVLLTRDDVRRVKPHPEHLLEGLKRLRVPPERAMMVGDHPTDIRAAQAAGMVSVALTTTRSAADFEIQADFVIDDIANLVEIIESQAWLRPKMRI